VKIVGQPQESTRFNAEIGGINFLGQVADETLVECYLEAQAFVLVPERTSGGEGWEGFGIVYLEAAAAGLPIIATDTGGVTEAVTTDGALTLEVNCSPEDIASVLVDLLFEISVAKDMALANRIWAESQKWDHRTGQVQALLSRVALQT
jgi:glycosyltransferase involved in cell wall biosynthesis